jgi:hypothetical protein
MTSPNRLGQGMGASVPDQALAVPAEPVARLDPSGFDPSRSDMVSVPRDAPEIMWDGLPRAIMLWMDFSKSTPRTLFHHLRCSGYEIPAWMEEEGELLALDHVPSKGTRCVLIYRAMIENWLASGMEAGTAETAQQGSGRRPTARPDAQGSRP